MSSEEDFNMLENSVITSAGRGRFSTDFKAPSNENLAAKHSLQRDFSLSHANQEENILASEISGALKVTEEPQAQILKPDLEIPHQAKVTSIPLSFFPSKLQQLLLAAERKVSEAREATETQSVIYIWPVIKMQESSRSFWQNFSKSLIPSRPDLTRHSSSPDVIEDEKSSQIISVKKRAQEEPDGKTARFYPLIVKSSNSSISEILKSLTNIKNEDYKNMLTLSSISPIGEQREIPLFKGNALMIYNGQVYLLYVMRHEDLAAEMKISGHHMLFMKTIVWLITCRSVRKLTFQVSHPLLLREDAVKQNMKCLTTCATPTLLKKTSNATHFSSHTMTTISQPENCSPLAGEGQQVVNHDDQFLCQAAFPSREDLQKRNDEEARQDKDKEIRKKFGIVKGVRIVLNRLSASELRKWTVKPSAHKKRGNY